MTVEVIRRARFVLIGETLRVNDSELIERVTALRDRAAEIAVRIRRDGDLLAEVHHELSATLNRLASLCTNPQRSSLPAASALTSSHVGPPPIRLLRIEHVTDRLGLSRSHVWRMVKDRRFPKPRRLSSRAVAWLESDVIAWISERPVFDAPSAPASRGRRRPSGPA